MMVRMFGVGAAVLCIGGLCLSLAVSGETSEGGKSMHGTIGKMTAVEGKRDELIALLLSGTGDMPGCLSYVVAKDPADANAIWITEVWDRAESHKASLTLPGVQDVIKRGRPLIAKFDMRITTQPVGGHGIPQHKAR